MRKKKSLALVIDQLLTRTPVEYDPLYQCLTTYYESNIGPIVRRYYGDPSEDSIVRRYGKFKEKLEDNVLFLLPRPEFKQTKDYEKVIVEVGSGIPPINQTVLDRIISSKGKGYPKEVVELCEGVLEGSYLYVGIDLGLHARANTGVPNQQFSKIARELLKHKIYKKENIVFIGANVFHILPFIKDDSADAIINYSGGDVPVYGGYYAEVISASYLRIIKPMGKFFADFETDAPQKFFKWPDKYKSLLDNKRGNHYIIEDGVFIPIKKLEK